jgi:hypothetical protein
MSRELRTEELRCNASNDQQNACSHGEPRYHARRSFPSARPVPTVLFNEGSHASKTSIRSNAPP